MDSKNKKTAFKRVRQGLAIFKTGQSQYYFARIWLPKKKKYVVKSTKETSRVDASEDKQKLLLEGLSNMCDGMISLRNQNGAITSIVTTSALFGERGDQKMTRLLRKR